LTDPISPMPRLDLRQVSAKTSPIRGAEQNKGGCVLDHPELDRGTRIPFGTITPIYPCQRRLTPILFKKRPTVRSLRLLWPVLM
jgi:hypothetical protein